jgi:hypothetical protein
VDERSEFNLGSSALKEEETKIDPVFSFEKNFKKKIKITFSENVILDGHFPKWPLPEQWTKLNCTATLPA